MLPRTIIMSNKELEEKVARLTKENRALEERVEELEYQVYFILNMFRERVETGEDSVLVDPGKKKEGTLPN